MVDAVAQREISLREARDEVERASRAKGEFLANVSHEFRTSLNGILGMNSLLSKTELVGTQAEHLQAQRQAARVLQRLVDDLLEVSGDGRAMTSAAAEVDLHELVDSLETRLSFDDGKVGLTWTNDVPAGATVHLDEEPLIQIATNLVSNARKYTHDGSITVGWKLVTGAVRATAVQLTVRDTGIGIPSDQRERVFDSFVQIDPSHTKTRRGLGLGLTIVKRACDALEASVTISSNDVEGRTAVAGCGRDLDGYRVASHVRAGSDRGAQSPGPINPYRGTNRLLQSERRRDVPLGEDERLRVQAGLRGHAHPRSCASPVGRELGRVVKTICGEARGRS